MINQWDFQSEIEVIDVDLHKIKSSTGNSERRSFSSALGDNESCGGKSFTSLCIVKY